MLGVEGFGLWFEGLSSEKEVSEKVAYCIVAEVLMGPGKGVGFWVGGF